MAESLHDVPLFRRLPLATRAALEAAMVDREVPAGTVLFREGDRAAGSEGLYVLRDGSLTLSVRRPSGGFSVLRTFDPGEVVGIIGLIQPKAERRGTVVAGSDARVSHLSRPAFLTLVNADPKTACSFYGVLALQLVHDLRKVDEALRMAVTRERPSVPIQTLVAH